MSALLPQLVTAVRELRESIAPDALPPVLHAAAHAIVHDIELYIAHERAHEPLPPAALHALRERVRKHVVTVVTFAQDRR